MRQVVFENARPALQVAATRADIACFVGLVRRQPGVAVPSTVLDWLQAQGWQNSNYARPTDSLADLPVPVENWAAFTTMFDPGGGAISFGTDYLATAVRSFFAQGGRRCYVVRMDDPVAPGDDVSARRKKLLSLLPSGTYQPDDRRSWHGVGHLAGLPEVSFLVVPDLPVLIASVPIVAPPGPAPGSGPEVFVECAAVTTTPTANPAITSAATQTFQVGVQDSFTVTASGSPLPAITITQAETLPTGITFQDNGDGTGTLRGTAASSTVCDLTFKATNTAGTATQNFTLVVTENLAAPRLTDDDYAGWVEAVSQILSYLANSLPYQPSLREVQFVAALPLPQEAAAETSPSALLAQDIHEVITRYLPGNNQPVDVVTTKSISSPFLQLAYPWLKTTGSDVLRESLEPPDGALVGLLARNALKRGTFTSATKIQPAEIYDLWPGPAGGGDACLRNAAHVGRQLA